MSTLVDEHVSLCDDKRELLTLPTYLAVYSDNKMKWFTVPIIM